MLQILTLIGSEAAIVEQAAREGGWVAALFAAIVVSGFVLLGWFVRQLWTDLKDVQLYIRETLTTLVANSQECMGDVRAELEEFRRVISNASCAQEAGHQDMRDR